MFKWLINNMRRGFATNSSSSHSLVYFRNPVASNDTELWSEGEWGWDEFEISTLGEKLLYVLTSRIGAHGGWGADKDAERERAVADAMEEYGHLFPEFTEKEFGLAYDGYVDHQSIGNLKTLLPLARDPHVVIYGGNDNGGRDLTDVLASAGDAAEWGASTSWPESRQTPAEAKADIAERGSWW